MKKRIVILNDRIALRDRLINLGDRALTDGFYEVVKQNCDCDIVSGEWKNFPYFNIRKFKADLPASEITGAFEGLRSALLETSENRLRNETALLKLIDDSPVFNNRISGYIHQAMVKRFSRGIAETVKPFLFRSWFYERLRKKLQSADLVLNNGGAMISDNLEFYIPAHLFECYLAKALGKTVISMNQTVCVKKPLNRAMASFVYGMLDFHMTREPVSTDELIDMGIDQQRVMTSCDTAFAADYHAGKRAVEDMVRNHDLAGGGIGIAIRGDRPIHYETLTGWINHLENRFRKPIYYISTCKAHDMKVFEILSRACKISFLDDANDYRLLTQTMKHLDLVITDRYHTAIFAIVANTPVLPLKPQSIKMEGLFSLFDYPFTVLPLEADYPKQLIDNADHVFRHKDEVKRMLKDAYTRLNCKVHQDMKMMCRQFVRSDID